SWARAARVSSQRWKASARESAAASGLIQPATTCRRRAGRHIFRFDTAPPESVAQQKLDLRVDAAKLALRKPLELGPDGRIQPKQEGLFLSHDNVSDPERALQVSWQAATRSSGTLKAPPPKELPREHADDQHPEKHPEQLIVDVRGRLAIGFDNEEVHCDHEGGDQRRDEHTRGGDARERLRAALLREPVIARRNAYQTRHEPRQHDVRVDNQ